MKQITGPALSRRIRRIINSAEHDCDYPLDDELEDRLWDIVFTLERNAPLDVKQSAADQWTELRSGMTTRLGLVGFSAPRWILGYPPTTVHWIPLPKARRRAYRIVPTRREAKP